MEEVNSNPAEPKIQAGDLVCLKGGVTPMLVVQVTGATAHCALLPYRPKEPVLMCSLHQLEVLRISPKSE